jgi:hypothetical protein
MAPRRNLFRFGSTPAVPPTPTSLADQVALLHTRLSDMTFGTECVPLNSLPVLSSWDYLLGARIVDCGGVSSLQIGRVPACAGYGSVGQSPGGPETSDCLSCQ